LPNQSDCVVRIDLGAISTTCGTGFVHVVEI
jgi:hypothetical protein